MANILIVANETLGGRNLLDAVRKRNERGDADFTVIAPQNRPRSGYVIYAESVRDAAQHRVDHLVEELQRLGIHAQGEVMDPDPWHAIKDAIAEFDIDEIIISTYPVTRSGWMRRDLVERVEELGHPVQHVVVDPDEERQELVHTLVVANHTLSGAPLFGLLKGKAEEKQHRFTVLVPPRGGEGQHVAHARERLEQMLGHMRDEGLNATGSVGEPDPFTSIMNALQYYLVDEIVISTHPATRSGWLRSNLVERVRGATSTPVEHVVVDIEAQGSSS